MPMEDEEPTLNAATRMRWLDVPAGAKVSSVEWCDDLLLLGANRSRILVVDAPVGAAHLSSGVLEPCGALLCDRRELPVGEMLVPHSAHAASTLVRSVRANRDVHKGSILGVRGSQAFVWDLEGGGTPVREWAPHEEGDETAPLMFARWAPKSDSVVLTGSYDGCVMLIDTKSKNPRNGLSFATQKGYAATAAEFNPLLPFVTAVAQMDGSVALYDVRYTTFPVLTVPSLQGDIACLQWMRLNADMLLTGGSDGSVALWNIRSPPTYCVGRAQYAHSVADLVTTETYTEQRALGLCIGGELTLTGLRTEAMMLLGPTVGSEAGLSDDRAAALADPEEGLSTAEMREKEAMACGFLYTRRLKEAFSLLSECAMNRFALKDTDTALLLVGLIDVNHIPLVDYAALIESKVAEDGVASNMTLDDIRRAFDLQLSRATDKLCTTVPLDHIRALSKPQPADMQKLEALRLNVLLSRVLETQDTDKISVGVEKALELLSAHPESFELIDADIVCGIVALLLKRNFEEGEKFVRFLLSQLSKVRAAAISATLTRRILCTVQEPHVTGGDSSRTARRFMERFLRNIPAAQDAVLTQLTIQRLGIEHPKEVIATMTAYQSRCVEHKLPGMFNWLGFKPLLLFLHCLTAESKYVPFFWTCVQCIDAYGKFPGVRQFESVLFAVVDRINAAASQGRGRTGPSDRRRARLHTDSPPNGQRTEDSA
ncbi:hypothetical protein STCU_09419 [Strigomonas culicis]|uniref:Uncharacterized protein n=1 Tax=Strigomonas culicis TaxID=28005 RepID=S9TML7_9TRYP|nr:hypothetical protein STCU_09419 [Strigomonas culicis]|eukprot:EPY19502.1 hypothetical protein STCU_09419 [Strigomonas culicis]